MKINPMFRVLFGGLLCLLAGLASVSADEPIRIGVLLPSTGVFGGLGKDQKEALQMGFDHAGRTINGRPIQLIYGDTESRPLAGLTQVKRLILKNEVDILVGVISSAVAGAVRDYVEQSQIPLVITNAGNDELTGSACSPWIVRVSFSSSQITRPMGPYLSAQGYRRGFLMAFDYVAGHQMMDAFRTSFEAHGGQIVGEAYPPLGETKDFAPYFPQIKKADPEFVFVFFAGGPAIKFVKEWKAFGMQKNTLLTGAGWLHSALYVKKQGSDAVGTLGILNYYPTIDNPANHAFQQQFRARYQREGTEFGVAAYDATQLIVAALKSVNGKVSDKQALVAAMLETKLQSPRGLIKIDPRTHNVIQDLHIAKVVADGDTVRHQILTTIKAVQDPPNGCTL